MTWWHLRLYPQSLREDPLENPQTKRHTGSLGPAQYFHKVCNCSDWTYPQTVISKGVVATLILSGNTNNLGIRQLLVEGKSEQSKSWIKKQYVDEKKDLKRAAINNSELALSSWHRLSTLSPVHVWPERIYVLNSFIIPRQIESSFLTLDCRTLEFWALQCHPQVQ